MYWRQWISNDLSVARVLQGTTRLSLLLLLLLCIGGEKETLKFDCEEERKPYTECTYLGTKIDQLGNNTTEIKHRISQRRKAINASNFIWWHKKNYQKQKIIYLSNYNSERSGLWCRSVANIYERNQ
jgi:hypothetical protein